MAGWTEAGLSSDGRLGLEAEASLPFRGVGLQSVDRGLRRPGATVGQGRRQGVLPPRPCSADGPELSLPSAVRRAGLKAGSLLGGWGAPAGSAAGTVSPFEGTKDPQGQAE